MVAYRPPYPGSDIPRKYQTFNVILVPPTSLENHVRTWPLKRYSPLFLYSSLPSVLIKADKPPARPFQSSCP